MDVNEFWKNRLNFSDEKLLFLYLCTHYYSQLTEYL